MTCIVAVAHNGKVMMGADSAGVRSYELAIRKDPKLFRVANAIIGFTSSFRMGQLLGFKLELPKLHSDTDLFRYMVTEFVEAVRKTLQTGGYSKVENNREEGGEFLVGISGRIFQIQSDFQVGESSSGYAACGCGEQLALGALHATEHLAPELRVNAALRAAEAFSAGVRGPFHIETVG